MKFTSYIFSLLLSLNALRGSECEVERKENYKIETESTTNKDTCTDETKQESKPREQPPKIGNFSLPVSQQPFVLYGFGGNIISQGEVQLFFFADGYFGRKKVQTDIYPTVLFGISDTLSILFTFPYAPYNREGHSQSSGLKDCYVQLEYAFYNKSTYFYSDQATLVGNLSAPTGSIKKNPHTGLGSAGFFFGATYSRATVDWFVFTAPGALLTFSDHGTKFGNILFYQFGFGKNIATSPGWIYAWIFEVDGQYARKDRIRGKQDKNSGGNSIFATPSLWISSEEMIIQFGVSFPLNQNLFGKQRKFDYGFDFNFSWSFY